MRRLLLTMSLGMFAGQFAALAGALVIPIEPEFAALIGTIAGAPLGIAVGNRIGRSS